MQCVVTRAAQRFEVRRVVRALGRDLSRDDVVDLFAWTTTSRALRMVAQPPVPQQRPAIPLEPVRFAQLPA